MAFQNKFMSIAKQLRCSESTQEMRLGSYADIKSFRRHTFAPPLVSRVRGQCEFTMIRLQAGDHSNGVQPQSVAYSDGCDARSITNVIMRPDLAYVRYTL